MKGTLLVTVLSLTTVVLLGWSDKKPLLKNGVWKAELQRADGRHIVFNFETKDSAGRKVLYVNKVYTFGIVGMTEEEAQPLLQRLYAHITRPEYVYVHKWRLGDVIMWDNWSTQHQAIGDYRLPQRRLMHRTAIMGTVPFESAVA